MEKNKIYCVDVLEGLKQLEDESIDLIITSPPYNKFGLTKTKSRIQGNNWHKTINYDDDPQNDNMNEDEYQDWQTEVLKECYRVLKKDGSMFYNHKNRINKGSIVSPYQWIFKTSFKIRQEIIWDRASSPNVDSVRYIPSTEKVIWLTKTTHTPRFKRLKDIPYQGEVWKIIPQKGTEHPAPMPIEIPNNIIPCVSLGERIIVLDPFCGSGTTLLSAKQNGCDFIGFEKFQKYVDMTERRLNGT